MVDFPNGTNEYGLNIFPSGDVTPDGKKWSEGYHVKFWTSTSLEGTNLTYKRIFNRSGGIYRNFESTDVNYGYSVRCVKD